MTFVQCTINFCVAAWYTMREQFSKQKINNGCRTSHGEGSNAAPSCGPQPCTQVIQGEDTQRCAVAPTRCVIILNVDVYSRLAGTAGAHEVGAGQSFH